MKNLQFAKVIPTDADIDNLYALLEKRKHPISHAKMPDFNQHAEFVSNHPYQKWWIVRKENELIGSVYITTENAVGINLTCDNTDFCKEIISWVISENTPLPPIPSVRPSFFHINVAPTNNCLISAIGQMNGMVTQVSYKI